MIPFPGYRIERIAGRAETTLRVWRAAECGLVDAAETRESADALAQVRDGTRQDAWRIETSVFTCAWPTGFALTAADGGSAPFQLIGPGSALLWVDGPLSRSAEGPFDWLVAPGQRLVRVTESGRDRVVDLESEHGGTAWGQRRYVVWWGPARVLVIVAQSPRAEATTALAAAETVFESVLPFRDG